MSRHSLSAPGAVRVSLWAASLITTACALYVFAQVLQMHSARWAWAPLMVLFGALFLCIAMSFWTATLGLVECIRHPPKRVEVSLAEMASGWPSPEKLPRTAILMPIYNEDPAGVAAGLRATLESLRDTGYGQRFDLFMLSDTTDPETWLKEELAWAGLRGTFEPGIHVFYRRRPRNTGRKSGNIADFCQRWGAHYRYMAIMDADSLMTGATLVEMVRRMEEDERIGILQAPVVPVNRDSLWARGQQFAARVYGDIFTTGFALWTRTDGNYFGHNALIRVAPFIRHCGLSPLPGRAPLGGEILSHDFVEAALMRRAGWKVIMGHDLGGSYEECPTTLADFAKRDQRWCQGNMQHVRLVFTCGLHPISRVHMGLGAMAYISSPLWLLFMILTAIAAIRPTRRDLQAMADDAPALMPDWVAARPALMLFLLTMALLLLPKLWGYLLLLLNRERLEAQGGAMKAGASVLLDTVMGVLTAPVLMAFHTEFVISTLLGAKVDWLPQRRHAAGTPLREAARAHTTHTLAGISAALAIALLTPSLFWWMSPVFTGLILSIPLDLCLGSVRVGSWLATYGFLLIPEETEAPEVVRKQRLYAEATAQSVARRPGLSAIYQVVADPAFMSMHLAILKAADGVDSKASADLLSRIRQIALHGSPMYLTREHRLALLSDEGSLRWLHEGAWTHWPLDLLTAACQSASNRVISESQGR